jgi:UDP-N-acetylmuramoyl-L-alanyl-D-glutamate--2,6-diaminopimelate ligase
VVSIEDDDVTALVDFAHTDDALRGLLEAVRGLARGRVITVFGCGGDRDATKRPLMGSVAARLSDVVVVTSDNPRSEDPEQIVRDIESGLGSPGDSTVWVTVLDRAEAIAQAIRDARAGDLVVIAGKGHERYQQIGARSVPFEDAAVAREALATRRSGSRV